MLSFLREQNRNSSLGTQSSQDTSHEPKQASEEYLTVAAGSKNVRKSTILLTVLFGIGLLCLCFMIKKSVPKTASADVVSAEESNVEMAIAKLTGVRAEMYSRMDEIVNKFYEFSDVLQVQVDSLVKNPFELEMFLASLRNKSKDGQKLDIDTEMLLQQLRQQVQGMQLLCIMQSDKGRCCMINDQILGEGDLIKSFKVVKIGDTSVNLKSEDEGMEIVLKLPQ
jgi:preprotein translocase subunit SecG